MPFDPDWVVAPAEILQEWMTDNKMTVDALARRCGQEDVCRDIIKGVLARRRITAETAGVLERGTGIGAKVWRKLERLYREGLAADKQES